MELTPNNTAIHVTPDSRMVIVTSSVNRRPVAIALGKHYKAGGNGIHTILTGEDIDYDNARQVIDDHFNGDRRAFVIDAASFGYMLSDFAESV